MNENQEQKRVIQFLRKSKLKHTAIVNSFFPAGISGIKMGKMLKARIKNALMGMISKFKGEGWNKGLCDILISVRFADDKKRLVFIEMKEAKIIGKRGKWIGGGKVSTEQQEWIDELNECSEVYSFASYGGQFAVGVLYTMMNDHFLNFTDENFTKDIEEKREYFIEIGKRALEDDFDISFRNIDRK